MIDSPTAKTRPPLGAYDDASREDGARGVGPLLPPGRRDDAKKGAAAPSSSPRYPPATRVRPAGDDDEYEYGGDDGGGDDDRECRNESGTTSHLPPIGRRCGVDGGDRLFSPSPGSSGGSMSVSGGDGDGGRTGGATTTPAGNEERDDDEDGDDDDYDDDDVVLDCSFPDDGQEEIVIRSPSDDDDDDIATMMMIGVREGEGGGGGGGGGGAHGETEAERTRRENAESVALARQLMAEEAMASYAISTEFLRQNADQFSSEDLAALQAAMAEEDPETNLDTEEVGGEDGDGDGDGDDDDDDDGYSEEELSYDALLRLGERIGDVKDERWALIAHEKIRMLPTLPWERSMAHGKEENHTLVKCQVCQFPYEEGDELRELPCEHYFHRECVDSWLQTKSTCALCRKPIC